VVGRASLRLLETSHRRTHDQSTFCRLLVRCRSSDSPLRRTTQWYAM